jgi:chromosome segregation ATPase
MTCKKPWWCFENVRKHKRDIKHLNYHMSNVQDSLEDWNNEIKDVNAQLGKLHRENVEVIKQRDQAWETIKQLKCRLASCERTISELQETLNCGNYSPPKCDQKSSV